jgi:small-conductance mechanosensitive channel
VAYGSDTAKVQQILNEVVLKDPLVLKTPEPLVIFIGFGQSTLDFRVLFWTRYENGLVAKSTIGMAIDDAFRKENIVIPFPQRDLHLSTAPEGLTVNTAKTVPNEDTASSTEDVRLDKKL